MKGHTAHDDIEKVLGMVVLDCLNAIHLTVKEAAPMMGVPEANLYSMLRGQGKYRLALVHLTRLPFPFWAQFGPRLFFLLAKMNIEAIGQERQIRKGGLRWTLLPRSRSSIVGSQIKRKPVASSVSTFPWSAATWSRP